VRAICIIMSATLCLALSIPATQAEEGFTAKALLDWCTGDQQSHEYLICSMYITGFFHGARIASQEKRSQLCFPEHLTGDEARNAFINMMRSHADLLDLPPDRAVWEALAQSFPCQKD
jgi:hypothetical protein